MLLSVVKISDELWADCSLILLDEMSSLSERGVLRVDDKECVGRSLEDVSFLRFGIIILIHLNTFDVEKKVKGKNQQERTIRWTFSNPEKNSHAVGVVSSAP